MHAQSHIEFTQLRFHTAIFFLQISSRETESCRRIVQRMRERTKKMGQYDEMGELKKGPWKVEEDEVLIKHVRKHGPRDWSSIRSNGLLRRTGKSCRLRWVNKLRPDLKTGVKFSAEEERSVIDLQAQFGNKWAKIATYLPGRTDNDVKNFWSSRQKRLARILHISAPSSSSTKPRNNFNQIPTPTPSSLQAPELRSSIQKPPSLPNSQFCSSSHIDDKMVPFWDLMYPSSLVYDAIPLNSTPLEKMPLLEQPPPFSFPQIPQLMPDFPLPIESQDFIVKHEDPSFLDDFQRCNGSVFGTAQAPIVSSFGAQGSCQSSTRAERHDTEDIDDTTIYDRLMYDLPPISIFDHIEPLPSPSQWL